MPRRWPLLSAALLGYSCLGVSCADWPMLRGEPQHSGFLQGQLKPPYELAWAREINNERLGTAMEPIVASGTVFLATHAGNLYALAADSGEAKWRFHTEGAFLHSPACARDLVVAGNTDGNLYALQMGSGQLAWYRNGGRGGFSAAPTVADDNVFIGTRGGDFLAIAVRTGEVLWRRSLGVPIRQTAAVDNNNVYVTSEDLRIHCFRSADGLPAWTSNPLVGQTARDYFPVVVRENGRTFVIVRTNPILNMGQRIGQDRTFLCRQAGVDDSTWQKLDAWTKSEAARGDPNLWDKEQSALAGYLESHQDARTFFVTDGQTGQGSLLAPVLWMGGCQGVGVQPARTSQGELLVMYRSAYGNWNQGVAPLVALGLLNVGKNHIAPLFHQQGPQPQWNCFWGTADESQNLLIVGDTALLIHQGTLSGFNLKRNELFPIWGERDTYGGFSNPPWARNEWHGPARGGVAVVEDRIYWLTGSRILCLVPREADVHGPKVKPEPVSNDVASAPAPHLHGPSRDEIAQALARAAEEVLSKNWAPLFTDPGLAGRFFSFDNSAELFEALAWAYPHLPGELQVKTKTLLFSEWKSHPPFSNEAWYSLKDGARREWFRVPEEFCVRLGTDKRPLPFGNIYSIWLFARRCGEQSFVTNHWPLLKAAYVDFAHSNWRLDPAKGDVFANRYLASLLAIGQLAEEVGDLQTSHQARAQAEETLAALVQWWERAGGQGTLKTFATSAQLDPFIGHGDGIFIALAPHRHKLGLFQDMSPEVAALLRSKAPKEVDKVWRTFSALCPTWYLMGEERQVHFGENFVDEPDFAMSGFRAFTWLEQGTTSEMARRVDLPFCRADLHYLTKLALTLEAMPAGDSRK